MNAGQIPARALTSFTSSRQAATCLSTSSRLVRSSKRSHNRLNDLGIRVALDDFGAGYNSLTYWHELPVQIVKLDRGLAAGVEPGRNLRLYRSVIGLCEPVGLNVIAEGIETHEQAETVFLAGCRLGQGHLFGRATDLAGLVAF
ncbi:EAL domain-containing protein [Mycobacterium sp. 050134]